MKIERAPAREDERFCFWQRDLLWSVDANLAEVRFSGATGWSVIFPSQSPLLTPETQDRLHEGSEGLGSWREARQFASAAARESGYRMVSGRRGIELVQAAQAEGPSPK